jgi:GTP-binding protein EngB required for normal cell division
LMDIRHPLQHFDVMMLEWAYSRKLFVHVLLTKSDKLTSGQDHINFIDEIAGKRVVGNPINRTVLPLKFNFARLNGVGNRGTSFVFFQSRP